MRLHAFAETCQTHAQRGAAETPARLPSLWLSLTSFASAMKHPQLTSQRNRGTINNTLMSTWSFLAKASRCKLASSSASSTMPQDRPRRSDAHANAKGLQVAATTRKSSDGTQAVMPRRISIGPRPRRENPTNEAIGSTMKQNNCQYCPWSVWLESEPKQKLIDHSSLHSGFGFWTLRSLFGALLGPLLGDCLTASLLYRSTALHFGGTK